MKREKWINIYKAILIILVVLGHTSTSFGKYIYTFHIAAFFLISGYLYKNKDETFVDYVKRKFKSLIVPYLIGVFILTILAIIMSNCGKIFYPEVIKADQLFLFARYLNTVDLAGAAWFLPVLFFTELLFKFIDSVTVDLKNKNLSMFIICFILALWGYTYYQSQEILPYLFEKVYLAILIFDCGYLFKKVENKIPNFIKHLLLLISIIIIFIYTNKYWTFINWPTNSFPNILVMILLSCSGGYIVYYISKQLSKLKSNLKITQYIGEHSLSIMLYHFLGFKLLFGILYYLKIVDLKQSQSLVPLYVSNIYGIATTIIAILFALAFDKFLKKLFSIEFKNIDKKKMSNIILVLIIIVLTFLVNSFIFDKRNFFSFDDFSLLKNANSQTIGELFSILPGGVYNSRPVGHIIMKILYDLFGDKFIYHALVLLITHIINTVLVFFLAKKMFKFNNISSFIISMIFGVFPTSIMAFTWESARCDLFGCTIVLLCLLLFVNLKESKKIIIKIIDSIFIIILYYLGLRTKEMLIALPCIMLVYSAWKEIYENKNKISKFLKDNILIIVLSLIMIFYFVYSMILKRGSTIEVDINNPYYYVFNPLLMVKNLLKYIYLYFNLNNMELVYNNPNHDLLIATSLFFIIIIIYAIYKLIKKEPKLMYMGLCFCFMIAPVLPMKNMQHILYLYIPSIFMSMIIVYLLNQFKTKFTFQTLTIIVGILFLSCNIEGVILYRNWWFSITEKEKITYDYLKSVKNKYNKSELFCVNNIDESSYNSFYYGPGAIINLAFDNNKIETRINDKNCHGVIINCTKKCKIEEKKQPEKEPKKITSKTTKKVKAKK